MERISGSTSLHRDRASEVKYGKHTLTRYRRHTYRYLFRKTPLKMASIMLSISALFSCSFGMTSRWHTSQISATTQLLKTPWSYLCDLLLYSLQLRCAFLSHRLGLLHLVQFLAVFDADAQAQGHAHKRAKQLYAYAGMCR